MRELVELGVSWIWMGLESPRSAYAKLKGADTLKLTRELRQHGIKLLGSTIVGLEHHTPENIHGEIEHAVAHDTDFHQFMLYTPVPGTPLYLEMTEQGRMLRRRRTWPTSTARTSSISATPPSRAKIPSSLLDWAFRRDFERNGPSIYRICRTTLEGWRRYKNDADPRVRARFAWEARALRGGYAAALWAMEKHLRRTNPGGRARRSASCARKSAASSACSAASMTGVLGPVPDWTARREARRLAAGETYEPPTIIERRNWTRSETRNAPLPPSRQTIAWCRLPQIRVRDRRHKPIVCPTC